MRKMIFRCAVGMVLFGLCMSAQAGHLFTQGSTNTPVNLTTGNGIQIDQLAFENAGRVANGDVRLYFASDFDAGDVVQLSIDNYTQTFSFDNPLPGTGGYTFSSEQEVFYNDPALVGLNLDLDIPLDFTVSAIAGDFTLIGYRIGTAGETVDGSNSGPIDQTQVVPNTELPGGSGGGVFMPVSNSVSSGTAEMLDSLVGTSGELGTVVTALSTMSEAERTAVQQRIAPQTSQAIVATATQTMEGPLDAIRIRLDNIRTGSNYQYQLANHNGNSDALADHSSHGANHSTNHNDQHNDDAEETGISSGDTLYNNRSAWIKTFGGKADQDGRRGYAGYDSDMYGLVIATDVELESGWITGAAFTIAEADISMNDFRRGDSADIHTYQLTAYAAKGFDGWYMENMLAYAYQEYETERNTTVTGVAEGDFDGYQIALRSMLGKPYHLDTESPQVLTPFVSLAYNYISQESYDEKGAGPLSLSIDSESVERLKTEIGVEYDSVYRLKNGNLLQPSLRLGWRHEFEDEGVDATASFVGGGGEFFTEGQNVNDDTYFIGAGLKYQTSPRMSIQVRIDGEASNGYTSYSGQTLGVINF